MAGTWPHSALMVTRRRLCTGCWIRGRPKWLRSPSLGQLSQVLARRRTVCLRHPHRYHVGQVDDYAILVGLAVISGMGQDQAAPFVQRAGDGLKRLAFPGKVLRYHGDVFPAHRVKSYDQHDVVRHSRNLPARIRKTARPSAVPRSPSSGGLTADPDTVKCARPPQLTTEPAAAPAVGAVADLRGSTAAGFPLSD